MLPTFYLTPIAYDFILFTLAISILELRYRVLTYRYCLWPFLVWRRRQMYRLFTSLVIHVNGLHLATNLLFLIVFMPEVEYMLVDDFGYLCGWLLLIVLLAAIAGIAGMASAYNHRNELTYTSTGCSAVVSGMVAFYFFYLPADVAPLGTSLVWPALYSYQIGLAYLLGLALLVCLRAGKAAAIHWYGALAGTLLAGIMGFPHWKAFVTSAMPH